MKRSHDHGVTQSEVEVLLESLDASKAREGVAEPLDGPARRRLVGAVLAAAASPLCEEASQGALSSRSRAWFARPEVAMVAAVCLLALGAVLTLDRGHGVALARSTRFAIPLPAIAALPGSRVALLVGEVRVAGQPARASQAVPLRSRIETAQGRAVLSLPTGIAVSLAERTSLEVSAPTPSDLEVRLVSGEALFAVERSRDRRSFKVRTDRGAIDVKGTLFTVVASGADVEVLMHGGTVEVASASGGRRAVTKGERTSLATLETGPVPQEATATAAARANEIEELDLGVAAVSQLEERAKEVVHVGQEPAASSSRSEQRLPSIKELMNEARQASADKRWAAAAEAYEALLRLHPRAAEAHTALVLLGRIELDRLGRPADAAARFAAYLASPNPGPLSSEALYDKARAERSRGDLAAEAAALEQYCAQYPEGTRIHAVTRRLEQLRAP